MLLLFLKCLSFLAALIMLIYFFFRLAPKGWLNLHKKKAQPWIEIIEYKRLDQKHAISLVSVDKIRLLLVTGPGSINVQQIVPENDLEHLISKKPNREIH